MERQDARMLYGNTNESSSIPDAPRSGARHFVGPFYSHGALILGNSFCESQPDALRGVVGQRLADALTVWEGYRNARMRNTPLLLRFENYDLVAAQGPNGELALWRGAVDTSCRIAAASQASAAFHLNDQFCFTWESERNLLAGIGSQVLQVAAATDELLVLDFENSRLILESVPDGLCYRLEGR